MHPKHRHDKNAHRRTLPAKCACDNPAVAWKFNQPVCARCLALESRLEELRRETCGKPEPDNGNTMTTYKLVGVAIH